MKSLLVDSSRAEPASFSITWKKISFSLKLYLAIFAGNTLHARSFDWMVNSVFMYSKPCVKRSLKNRQNKDLYENGSLVKVKSIVECSPSILLTCIKR